jgi:hypothetical protein
VRWLGPIAIAAACERASPDELDKALDCAVAAVAAGVSADPIDLVPGVLDTLHIAPREVELTALRRLRPAIAGLRASRAANLSHLAFAFAQAGDAGTARAVADDAVRAAAHDAEPERHAAVSFSALVIAWTGDSARAEQLAAGDGDALLAAAEGAARGGDRAAAARLLDAASHAAPAAPEIAPTRRALEIGVLAWLGRLDEARRELAAESDPGWHLYSAEQLARAAAQAKSPSASQLLREAVAEAERVASSPDPTIASAARVEQLALVGDLDGHGDHADSTALRAAMAAAPSLDPQILAGLAGRAAVAQQPKEADALLARLGAAAPADSRVIVAAMRGDLAAAIDGLAAVSADRRPETLMIVWARLAAAPDAALAKRFAAAACRR